MKAGHVIGYLIIAAAFYYIGAKYPALAKNLPG
jgi:hypothetical protein